MTVGTCLRSTSGEPSLIEKPESGGGADAQIEAICVHAGLRWVIVVDDKIAAPGLAAADVIGAIRGAVAAGTATHETLSDLLPPDIRVDPPSAEQPEETWPDDLEHWWDSSDPPGRESVLRALAQVIAMPNAGDPRLVGIGAWFPASTPLRLMEPSQWAAESEAILIGAKSDGPGLVLFDEDLRGDTTLGLGEEGGVALLNRALEHDGSDCVAFGLLSNHYTLDGEAAEWRRLGGSTDTSPAGRFIPLSKARLDQPGWFAHGLRLALINVSAGQLRSQVREVVSAAAERASDQIASLTPWDFERIVIESSAREGAWEVDTLLRLIGIVERRERRRGAHDRRASLDAAITAIRGLPQPPESIRPERTEDIRSLRRAELYLAEEDLNTLRLPIDIGDIFEREDGSSSYLLLAPACDLMLRAEGVSKGKRTLQSASLVPIKVAPAGAKADGAGLFPEMPYYLEIDDRTYWYLDLLRPVVVDLMVLDLATYRIDGRCVFDPDEADPDGLFTAQLARRAEVVDRFAKLVEALDLLAAHRAKNPKSNKDVHKRLMQLASRGYALETGRVTARRDGRKLDFGWRRRRRLLDPHASAFLGAFHAVQTRAAFEHDFADEPPPLKMAGEMPLEATTD